MAIKSVIADYLGKLRELVAGDVIDPSQLGVGTANATTFLRGDNVWATPAGAGGSNNFLNNTTTLSFPLLNEEDSTSVTISSLLITNTNFKGFSYIPLVSLDHDSVDDFQWDGLNFNIENIIDNVSFDIRGQSSNNTWGNYNIRYIIIY